MRSYAPRLQASFLCGLAVVTLPGVLGEDAPENPTAWKSSAALSLTATAGNTEQLMVAGNLLTAKKWEKNELGFGANFTYGEDQGDKNAESVGGFGQYNRLFSDKFYVYGRVDALHDAIADIEYRVSLSPGAGYYFLKNDRFTLSGEFGPGYVFEKLGSDTRDYLTLRFGERFTWKISDRARLWQSADYNPRTENFGDYVLNAEVGVESDISKHVALQAYVQDSYRSEPAAGRESNDLKVMAGIKYKF